MNDVYFDNGKKINCSGYFLFPEKLKKEFYFSSFLFCCVLNKLIWRFLILIFQCFSFFWCKREITAYPFGLLETNSTKNYNSKQQLQPKTKLINLLIILLLLLYLIWCEIKNEIELKYMLGMLFIIWKFLFFERKKIWHKLQHIISLFQ